MSDTPAIEAVEPDLAERPLGGLVKHSAMYSAAPLIRQGISVGMHRLYTGWLGSSGYGIKEIVDLWLIGLQQLLGQNVLAAMVRFYFDKKDERDRSLDSLRRIVTLVPESPLPRNCEGELVAPAEVEDQFLNQARRWPFRTYGDFRPPASKGISGTTDWTFLETEATIPEGTTQLWVQASFVTHIGKIYVDDLSLEIVE